MLLHRLEDRLGLVLMGLLSFCLVSVPLAMLRLFRPAPVAAATLFVWIVVRAVWNRGRDDPTFGRRSGATMVVLVVVLVLTGLNVRYSSQHLLTDRDPGVYITTARWLANEGQLLVEPEAYAFKGVVNEHRIRYAAAGYYEGHRDDGKLYPQFVHLLPATLGASAWIAGSRGMLKVNAVLGGLALLLFFVFATKLLRPWLAAAATITLGLSLVQIHFSRDAYTEVLTQILLFGGLWALLSAQRTFHPGRAAIAGLLVGSASMARIDAFIFLVPLAIYIAYDVISIRATGDPDPRHRSYLVALGAGAAVPAVIAFIDARLFSPVYLADLWGSVRLVWVALVAIAVFSGLIVLGQSRFRELTDLVRTHRETAALVVVGAIVTFSVLAYFVRPHLQTAMQDNVNRFVEYLQRREGLTVNGRRTYAEHSLGWLSLYLGPAALWSGLVGIALMTREVVLGRSSRAIPFTFAFLPMFVLYVWDPSITPDHVWALRRFLPVVIPGLILGCFWLLGRLWVDRSRAAGRYAAVAIGALALAFPAWTLAPVVTERTQLGVLSVTEAFCASLPEDAAVLVAQTQLLDQNFTQTVRTFCDVPAANAPMDQPMDWYRELARRWTQQGRVLYVVSPQKWFGTHWPLDGATYVAATTYNNLERSLTGRPDSYETFSWGLFMRRADLEAAS